jgi:hypothetical protein
MGLSTIDQRLPFQRSTSASSPAEPEDVPTAKQLVAVGHDTLARLPERPPRGLGLSTIVQRVPSHRSTKVLADDVPTAKQLRSPVHDTLARLPE